MEGKKEEKNCGEEGKKVCVEKQECNNSSKEHKNTVIRKGKSCKGTLYFSSTLKSKGKYPRCIGFPRTLQQVPDLVSQSETKATKNGRNLAYFKYACAGYSMYLDPKGSHLTGDEKPRPELPVCFGLEVVLHKQAVDHQAPAHSRTREGTAPQPQPRPQQTMQHMGEEFLNRFTRNAGLVASGVARNLCKVGNYVKESVDDILYKRPK